MVHNDYTILKDVTLKYKETVNVLEYIEISISILILKHVTKASLLLYYYYCMKRDKLDTQTPDVAVSDEFPHQKTHNYARFLLPIIFFVHRLNTVKVFACTCSINSSLLIR